MENQSEDLRLPEHNLMKRRQQIVLCDQKWQRVLRRTWLFKYIPFIEIVLGAGSLAVGNVDAESDFDMLIGVREGRIFTARFFAALSFGLLGWRRAKEHGNAAAADKICLNHFITPATYRFRGAPNIYWRMLYSRMVPLYGAKHRIQRFFDENVALTGGRQVEEDLRHRHTEPSDIKNAVEFILAGSLGDWIEEQLKQYQIKRIEQGAAIRHGGTVHQMLIEGEGVSERITLDPLIVYNDEELEFHPDPAVIEIRS